MMGTMRSSVTNVEGLWYINGLINTLLNGWMAFAVNESPNLWAINSSSCQTYAALDHILGCSQRVL